MSGWRELVRRELARFEAQTGSDVVELDEFLAQSRPVFAEAYPENENIDPKVRQVLQQLRERDEVAFVDHQGTYRIGDLDRDADTDADSEGPAYTAAEYETTVNARSMPAAFRRGVLNRYGRRCPVSGVDQPRLLDVAHVSSWSEYPEHRTDPTNVVALDKTHHAAFDAGLFTFDPDHRLRLAPDFETDSDVLRRTLVERAGERIDGLQVAGAHLERRNRSVAWW